MHMSGMHSQPQQATHTASLSKQRTPAVAAAVLL
jgi:hypothetical protein